MATAGSLNSGPTLCLLARYLLITPRIRSVREGNIFSLVYLSVCLSNLGGGGDSHVIFFHDALGHSITVYKRIMG